MAKTSKKKSTKGFNPRTVVFDMNKPRKKSSIKKGTASKIRMRASASKHIVNSLKSLRNKLSKLAK